MQEFLFNLRFLTVTSRDTFDIIPLQIIDLFKICFSQKKNFTANITVSKESSELYNNHCKANKTVEEFINNAPIQILLHGITITLQTDVQNINLDSFQQIEALLNEKLKHVEKTENEAQSQDTLQIEETKNQNRDKTAKLSNIGQTSCMVPECNGIKYEKRIPSKEELWDKYYTGVPKRRRQCVGQYKIVKRA